MVGWSLVAAGSICGIAVATIKGGMFQALMTAGAPPAPGGAAAWGYPSKAKA
jgi:hypothetical protein